VPLIAFAGLMQARVMWGLNAQARAACTHCERMSLHERRRLCSRRACAMLHQVSKAADVANQMASEALAAVRTVAAFGMEAALVAEFTRELAKPWRKFQETAVVTGLAFGASSAIIFLVGAVWRPRPAPLHGFMRLRARRQSAHHGSRVLYHGSSCAVQVYALAFWYGGLLVSWHEATFGEVLKVRRPCAMSLCAMRPANGLLPMTVSARSPCSAARRFSLPWCWQRLVRPSLPVLRFRPCRLPASEICCTFPAGLMCAPALIIMGACSGMHSPSGCLAEAHTWT